MRHPDAPWRFLLTSGVILAEAWGFSLLTTVPALGASPISELMAEVSVGEPSHYRNLTLFPVRLRRIHDHTPCLTLDEAMKRGSLTISELTSAEVNRVRVRNRSGDYVFLLAGEILVGAKQDRMVEDDTLLAPSSEIVLRVYCTEAGRWAGRTTTFESSGATVHYRLRQIARESRSQSRVWAEIEAKAQGLGASRPATGAVRRVYSQSEVQSRARPYVERFEDLPSRYADVAGVVVAVGEEILVADLFGNPSLFRRLWRKLLDSYVLDALDRPTLERRLDRYDAERFLENATRATLVERSTPGAGDLYDLRGSRVSGSALVHRGAVVHLDLFPRLEEPKPRPLPAPNLEFRRRRQAQ